MYLSDLEKQGKVFWFSGPPGAGKSTTACMMSQKHDFIYYEADCFNLYSNPFVDVKNAKNLQTAIMNTKPLKVNIIKEVS